MLKFMRRRLRALVKILTKTKQVFVSTDIPDNVWKLRWIDLHRVPVGVDTDRFRGNARQNLQAHLDRVALQKVRRNRPTHPRRPQCPKGDARRRPRRPGPDQRAGTRLQTFRPLPARTGNVTPPQRPSHGSWTPDPSRTQIDFIWFVVTHPSERGVMDIDLLYEPPFTDRAPHGPEGLVIGSDVDALTAVHATAGPAEGVA
jgi:type I restriction enzyme R subunit